jgi:hypothetical protein
MSKIKFTGDSGGTGVFTIASPDSDTNRTITLPDDAGTIVTSAQTTTAAYSFVVDEDNLASDLATKVPTQQSVKAYVDAQVGAENTLAEDNDVTLTSPGDAALLLYDTGTSMWRDAAMSGDATISDVGVITIAANAVDSAEIVAGSIDTAHIAADNIVGSIIADNTIDSEHYAAGSIDLEHMSVNSIDSDQYVDGSIDTVHIAADQITSALIADDQVDSEHIAAGAIDTAHIAADNIVGSIIADNAIDSEHYTDGSIDTVHIATSNITNALMADDAIDSAEIADGAVDLVHMSANSVDSNQYVDGSIDTAHIANDQITAALMADNSIDSDMYVDASIDLAHMSVNSVDSDQYVDGSVDNVHLANSSVTVSDGSNTSPVALGGTLTFAGTANEVDVVESAGTVTYGLPTNVTIAGNLTVSGTQTTVSSTTIEVADPLLHLATGNNAADAVDIGLYGLYDTSGSLDLYGGLFRDASDSGKWNLFKDLQAAPTTTVNKSGTGYATGTLISNLEGNVVGNLTGTASLATAITASANNSTDEATYLTFVDGATGTQGIETDTGLTYNPSSGNLTIGGTVDGRDLQTDGTKLDGIESGATADQTNAEIRAAVEAASDSNVFTDADHTKLNGIEASATADQTAAEILTLIKTVDGASSGLDADLLDAQSGAHYRVDIYNAAGSLLN